MQKTANTRPETRDAFSTLFTHLFSDALPEFYGNRDSAGAPRTNIGETDTSYELAFELPGLDEKDIHVNLQDHTLTITAERKDQREQNGGKRWHRVEHRYGQFQRTIALPHDAANNGIEAVYQKGVLTVTVPKAPESRPTKVMVRAG
jgi:HSP20 family protein